jgi:hypothetical protein
VSLGTVLLASATAPASAIAADTVINFDDQPAATVINTQYSAQGVTLDEGPLGPTGRMPFIYAPPNPGEAHSPPNVLDISRGCGGEFPDAALVGRFAAPRNHVSLFVGHVQPGTAITQPVTLQGFDLGGNPIAAAKDTVSFSGYGLGTQATITDPNSQISFFGLTSTIPTFCTVAVDDLSFDALPSTIPPDFGLSVQSTGLTLAAGNSSNATLGLHRTATSTGPISLSVRGLPEGVSASVSPNPTSGGDGSTMTLTLSAAANAPPAQNVLVTVTGTPSASAGSRQHSVTIPVSVSGNFDYRAQGIDVTQAIQRAAGILIPSGADSGGFYDGVPLVEGKQTAVRFFADAHGATGAGIPGVSAVLHGYRNGVELPGSPLYPDYGPPALPDTGEADPAPVFGPELISDANAFTFILPASWESGTIRLVGEVLPPTPGFEPPRYIECQSPSCLANNSFTENGVTFNPTKSVTLTTIAMTDNGTGPVPTSQVFVDAKLVTPLSDSGFTILPYQANVDVTDILNSTNPTLNKNSAVKGRVDEWAADNGHPNFGTVGVVRTGINGLTGGGTSAVDFTPNESTGDDRPLTSVAHELFHLLRLAHASNECGGGQDSDSDDERQSGVPWPLKPGDNEDTVEAAVGGTQASDTDPSNAGEEGFGQLFGVGLDMSSDKILADGLNNVSEYYDFMSYCSPTRGFGDAGNWVSPINWEAVFARFALASGASFGRIHQGSVASNASALTAGSERAAAALTDSELRVIAYATGSGVEIESVGPEVGPPLRGGSSPYTLTAHGSHGQVLATARMAESDGHADRVGPLDELTAELPVRGVQSIDVVSNGVVVASRKRPRHPPRVRILAPHGGATVGGRHEVAIRWSATNPQHLALSASVDYSRDGGRTWRTIFVGPNRERVSLPAFYLAGSRAARVRVRVNDGFNEASALSRLFTTLSPPPQVTISPTPRNLPGDAILQLSGRAFDQRLSQLSGRSLRWFDGPLLLGSGAAITAGPLPPGKNKIRLVARDAAGHTGSATATVTVAPVTPSYLRLVIPARVARRARKLAINATSAFAATLTVERRSFTLRAGINKLSLSIRPRVPLLLHLVVTAHGIRTPFAAAVLRR